MKRSIIESILIHCVLFSLLLIGTNRVGMGVGDNTGSIKISTHMVDVHDPGDGDAPAEQVEEQPIVEQRQPEPPREEVVEQKQPKPVEEVVEKEVEVDKVADINELEEIEEPEIEDNETIEEVAEVVPVQEPIEEIDESTDVTDNATSTPPTQVANVNESSTQGTGADGGVGSGAAIASGGSSGIFSLGDLDLTPKLLRNRKPEYPKYAKDNGITGFVRVGFVVDAKGFVKDPVVIEATPRNVFEKSALATVSKWRFSAGKKGGKDVSTKMVIVLNFRLEDMN